MTKHDPGIADSLGPSQLEVLHKKYRAACEEAQAERDVSVELRQQLAAAEARAVRFRAALEDIAWQNLYPTMADIARAALKGERKEQ